MALLLIRADANPQIGAGHVMRCLALAQAWQDEGGRSVFLMEPGAPAVEERLRNESMQVRTLLSQSGTFHDAAELATLSRDIAAAFVVVDGYHFPSEYQQQLKQTALRLVTIDDDAALQNYYGDVIVNPNPGAETLKYPCLPGTRLLMGTKYALLRREFRSCGGTRRSVAERGRNVLITMGGADPDNATAEVLEALAQLPSAGIKVTVVIGPNNIHEGRLRNLSARLRVPIDLQTNVLNMRDLIAAADLCVTAAGGTWWELAFMGTPMLLVAIAENQRSIGNKLAEEGCAVSLRSACSLSKQTIASAVWDLLQDSGRRQQLAENGRRLVDGRGAARVVKCLKPS